MRVSLDTALIGFAALDPSGGYGHIPNMSVSAFRLYNAFVIAIRETTA